jgi:hypothetical protein
LLKKHRIGKVKSQPESPENSKLKPEKLIFHEILSPELKNKSP